MKDARRWFIKQAVGSAFALALAACTHDFDAGSNRPHGKLPVDERNPAVLVNDGAYDNWQGEYALLLSNGGGPRLAGIVVGTTPPRPNIDQNVVGWRDMVRAARSSGLRDVPDPIASISVPLVRPASGEIEATVPNRSEGALFIVARSREMALPYRPMVVLTGASLTDAADAYLVDPTVAERIVVVSSLGSVTAAGGAMGPPNGEMDPWADSIVTQRLRYVQISASYDQLTDVPASRVPELPANPFGAWIAAKQPEIWDLPAAADQIAVAAVGLPAFAVDVTRVTPNGPVAAAATTGPTLTEDANGTLWLVRGTVGAVATARFWELLRDPKTFPPR